MRIAARTSGHPSNDERLQALGLTMRVVHDAFWPGLSHSRNRTALALRSTPGTDIYHDTMEQFSLLLTEAGWVLVYVDGQPRLLHPDGIMSFTVASATGISSANPDVTPRTHKKGKATKASLDRPDPQDGFFNAFPAQDPKAVDAARQAPFWFLLFERTSRGLYLELSRPAEMNDSQAVTDWSDRIPIPFLDASGDFTAFETDDDGDFDVPVTPR